MKFGKIIIVVILLFIVRYDKGLIVGMFCGLLIKYIYNMWFCLS